MKSTSSCTQKNKKRKERIKWKPKFVFYKDTTLKLPKLKAKPVIVEKTAVKPVKTYSYFTNSLQGFDEDEVHLLDMSRQMETDNYLSAQRNVSRLDLAKEQKLTLQKNTTKDKICDERVFHNFDNEKIVSSRFQEYGEEEEKKEVFVAQPVETQESEEEYRMKKFIPDLKDQIMRFAEEQEEKEMTTKESMFLLDSGSLFANEHKSYGRKRVINTIDSFAINDGVSINTQIMPAMYGSFSIPKMESYLFAKNLPVPDVITCVQEGK